MISKQARFPTLYWPPLYGSVCECRTLRLHRVGRQQQDASLRDRAQTAPQATRTSPLCDTSGARASQQGGQLPLAASGCNRMPKFPQTGRSANMKVALREQWQFDGACGGDPKVGGLRVEQPMHRRQGLQESEDRKSFRLSSEPYPCHELHQRLHPCGG